jgi:cell division protein FtsB
MKGALVTTRAARRAAVPLLIAVLTCGVLFLGVFPTRTYMNQRSATDAAEARLAELQASNEQRQQRVDVLMTDAEIERIAREQYGLARPGEEVYRILPPPEDPVDAPDAWPFNRLDQQLRN